ncbi:uncharacterized protein BO97DRAFT_448844 [Aspergillus homomorphus CBS 101889]|uniref:Uncharacterized protein n=1 Tax=Aspergillus homomorphus (strain CBS 101889) TaxID=1450537 RepID=A0A395HFA5_ASPHC|nr:hypothetical protein BO97DRAFT_448844 [Aspergillus homomorphus CBS 101889]RAL06641.1 hypothetical protein BO97DRAFT_448844 [Aspergillus homomorphus CBS 101889]
MAWYSALFPCMPWFKNPLRRNSTNRNERSADDLTSLTDKMPNLGEKAKYVDGKSFMAQAVLQNKPVDDRKHCGFGGSDLHSTSATKPTGICSDSISDQSTSVGETNHEALREPELFAVRSSYIDESTGRWMASLYYELSLSLDDLEIKGYESHISESKNDSIEAIFHYKGDSFWISVPYSYAISRRISSGLD